MRPKLIVALLVDLVFLATALSTGGALYYLLSAMLPAMILIALETVLVSLFATKVKVSTGKKRASRGENITVRVWISRKALLPIGALELVLTGPADDDSAGRMAVNSPTIRGKEYRYSIACAHRGTYELGVSRLVVSDVFGLFVLGRKLRSSMVKLEVVPNPIEAQQMKLKPSETGSQGRILRTEDATSPSGVRQWQDGDELKRVHWKLTMRKRELMVRTFEESARPDTLVLMDVHPVSATKNFRLVLEDCLCEAAAGAVLAQLTAGYPVRMPLPTRKPTEVAGQSPADFQRFLDELTHVQFDGEYSYEQILALEMRRMQRTGGVVLVTTRMNAVIADLAIRMKHYDMVVKVLWITDSPQRESMELMERMKISNIETKRIDPWR